MLHQIAGHDGAENDHNSDDGEHSVHPACDFK